MAKLPVFSSLSTSSKIRGFSAQVYRRASTMDIRLVVARLTIGDLDPNGRERNIGSEQTVRLDRQANISGGGANLQIQVNNAALEGIAIHREQRTTIAQVIVPATIFEAAWNCPEHNIRRHLERTVRAALVSGCDGMGLTWTIAAK